MADLARNKGFGKKHDPCLEAAGISGKKHDPKKDVFYKHMHKASPVLRCPSHALQTQSNNP